MTRPELIALAADADLAAQPIRHLGMFEALPIFFLLMILFGMFIARINFLAALVSVFLFTEAWFMLTSWILVRTGVMFPLLPPILSALFIWRSLSLQQSSVMKVLQRSLTWLLGVKQDILATAVDVMAGPALVFDRTGSIIACNSALQFLMLGDAGSGRDPKRVEDILGADSGLLLDMLDATGTSSATRTLEVEVQTQGGLLKALQISVGTVSSLNGPLGIASFKDITSMRDREQKLTTLAFKDSLTGLSNRLAFRTRIAKLEAAAERDSFALLLIDFNSFHAINEAYGHDFGDLVLKEAVARIRSVMSPDDAIFRLGSDDFVIIHHGADEDTIRKLAGDIVDELARRFDLLGEIARISGSVGIALWPQDSESGSEVLQNADAALRSAKKQKTGIVRYVFAASGDLEKAA